MTDEQRLGPPPIEPISEAAWSRVERRVWSELDSEPAGDRAPSRGPRRWWLVAVPLAAATAVTAAVIVTRPRPGELSDEPSRVVSGTAPSSVSFGDSHIELDASTALVMSHEAAHPIVLLERGAAWFTVAPRHSRPEFIVRAGDAMVVVVGTRFRVARSEERIAVDVERGQVDVTFRGAQSKVHAGEHWASNAPVHAITASAGSAEPSDEAADEAPGPAPETTAPDVTAPEVTADARPRKHAHQPARPAKGSADPRIEVKPPSPGPQTESQPSGVVEHEQAQVDADRAEYDRLAALEPRSPAAALAGYLKLARGTSRWADPALFAAARLAVDLHDRRAATLLGMYLQRFPSGANATDATQLLDHLKTENGDNRP